MDKLLPISVFIITRDEADRIARTIQAALRLTSDIVVVDSGSTDGTREIAQKLGARVVHNEWPGYGAQKNFAQELCNHDWVLNLDADEVLSDELISEIRSLFDGAGPQADAYRVRIVDVIPGETQARRFAYAFDPVRLYRKECGRFSLSTVHDRVQLHPDAVQSQLRGKVQHFSMRGIGAQLAKFNEYTDAQVDDIIARGGAFLFMENIHRVSGGIPKGVANSPAFYRRKIRLSGRNELRHFPALAGCQISRAADARDTLQEAGGRVSGCCLP